MRLKISEILKINMEIISGYMHNCYVHKMNISLKIKNEVNPRLRKLCSEFDPATGDMTKST